MNQKCDFKSKIVSAEKAKEIVSAWQSQGEKVVFTNGCFDLVHRGHVEYLAKAAEKGSKLVLGLNTDSSVQRLKGPSRPIVDEDSRAVLLAALGFIDVVVLFDEDTPYELIKTVQPDVLVKGADYKPEDIVGYDVVTGRGGSVETITFVEGFSTTNIIEKISEEVKANLK
ncbi:D-glycero-beta-D-manno-heptose 1-phosphate adenylyltransferase [Plebeiibacterium sediminum]|uniref:D-glycero-beta-D-manno-heptose 1-phosphate adenylyltransferase n=1 Tax=Plebeiibacterium sediminum TaxID=2992112 RepID=A0AAE3M7Z8_9BACT|nr:D-glycero-beta-D-manno-heptose 1-phosphate adenylyltransferase [Plebeiobacterium sediminum]MCW3788622.1 D-glycero-beta-D-manno-heptose 1-phosphate adenylyltransferase [Plebeiobacterium sediminum]